MKTRNGTTLTILVAAFLMPAHLIVAQPAGFLTNGLVAYYPFNGNANDESGNGNNGAVTAATLTADRFGNPNSAYAFDGVSSVITVPDSPSLRIAQDITVVCWLKFSQSNLNARFVGKGGDCGRNYGLWGLWGPTQRFWMFQQFPPEGGCIGCQENTGSTVPTVQIGKWYQMVGVRSGNVSRLYLDGILLEDGDGHPENCSPTTYTGSEPLLIGAPGYVGAPPNDPALMQGSLDDIRIYNRALTDQEVAALYDPAGCATTPTQGVWTNKANLPQAEHVNGGRSFGVAALNGKFYTVGGLNHPAAIPTVLEYDPASDAWTRKANLLTPRYAPAAAAVNGKLYAIGGAIDSSTTQTASIEEYDLATDTWINRASMSQKRYAFSAVSLNGKIYVMGGQDTGDVPLASVEEYDPVSNSWTSKASMPTPRISFGAAVLDGKIYVVGGRMGNTPIAPTIVYDPASNTWATKASIPTTRGAPAAVSINGKIWVLGGDIGNPGGSTAIEEYWPTCDVWTTKPPLPSGRNECFAVLLGDSLYVFGGYDTWTMQALSIPPPPCAPVIVIQPSPMTVQVGSTATLCANATGAQPLNYQWWFNRTNLIAGGTNSSLSLVNVQSGNSGVYSAVVSNAYGSTTSLAVRLTVTVPLDSDGDGLSDDYERGFGRYILIATNLTWPEAKMDAERRGGHLATITSQAEWDAILAVIGPAFDVGGSIWLGATDEQMESDWRWVTGEPWSYTRWNFAEPNNVNNEDYLQIIPFPGTLWNDEMGVAPHNYLLEFGYYTDPNNPDTDGDGFTDGDEVAAGSSPVDANDTPPGRFNQFTLSATTPGGGLVIPNPLFAGYPSNRLVTLTATAASGWTFLGWQGDAAGGNPAHTFTMSRPRCVQGFFGTAINRSVVGSGSVTLLPQAALYPYGATVKLVAEPQPANFFAHWTNSVSGGQNPRTFTVNSANPLITAVFAPLSAGQFALTTLANGPGRVIVTPQTNRYPSGASVTLRAIPDAGQSFTGWSDDASGAVSPLTVTMDQSKVVTANFTRRPRMEAVSCLGEIRTRPFVLTIAGELGEHYEVQCSTDLMNWSPLATVTNALGAAQWSDASRTNEAQQFYRATLVP